jgi:hypothetical protein
MQHNFSIPNKPLNSDEFKSATGWDLYIRGDDLVISGECTKAQAQSALDAHNPPDPQVAIALAATAKAELLARLGITADEAKLLLG